MLFVNPELITYLIIYLFIINILFACNYVQNLIQGILFQTA